MSQRRLTWSSLIAAAAATMALGMPGIAAANGYWHPANNEAGFTTHPDHFKSSKTRAEVRAEAEAAMRQQGGLLASMRIVIRPLYKPMVREKLASKSLTNW